MWQTPSGPEIATTLAPSSVALVAAPQATLPKARLLEEVLGEIEGAEAGGLRTEDGAAPGAALAGEHAGVVLAGELLVHAVHVADLTAAHAHVAGGNVLVRADAVPELQHEGLAEAHDLVVGLAHGVEVGAALGAAHREGGEGVLEGLFETEELEHGRGHRTVEAEAALIGGRPPR